MKMTLEDLITEARKHQMTDRERREQVASFAFGNLALTKEWSSRPIAELGELRTLCRKMAGCE
jgi:hypothetical protein